MTIWKWAAASQRGTAHIQAGDHRQDAFRVLAADAGFLIMVACDGAGSTRHGGQGAALVARLLSSRAKAWITSRHALPSIDAITLWVEEARASIAKSAERIGCTIGDFATTLVMAISNGRSTLTAHIGDGAIVARCSGSGDMVSLSWPNSGDYASETFFLTDAVPSLRLGVIDDYPIDRLALLTDGMERLSLDFAGHRPHTRFFECLLTPLAQSLASGRDVALSRQLAAFLVSDSVNARTDDDKTLVIALLS